MITEQDLQEAIAECEGVRHPTSSTCLKLAAYYTLQEKMFGEQAQRSSYSFAQESPETQVDKILYLSDTEFSEAIYGKKQQDVFGVLDDLMSTLEAINPRLYQSVMRKLRT